MADLMAIQSWLAKHHEKVGKYAGKWVAVSSIGIVEDAESLQALSGKLGEKQKTEMLLTRIPTRKEAANLVFYGGSP